MCIEIGAEPRALPQRAHQGRQQLSARHARRRPCTRTITGAIAEDDQQLVKFHGMYLQDDRDLRGERTQEEAGEGVRVHDPRAHPGRRVTPKQWLAARRDRARPTATARCAHHAPDHPVPRRHQVEPEGDDAAIDEELLDTIAACGDVNRNVMSTANPYLSKAHRGALDLATAFRSIGAADPGLSRDLARRREDPRRRGRTWSSRSTADLPAAQIQDRGGGAARQRRRHLRA